MQFGRCEWLHQCARPRVGSSRREVERRRERSEKLAANRVQWPVRGRGRNRSTLPAHHRGHHTPTSSSVRICPSSRLVDLYFPPPFLSPPPPLFERCLRPPRTQERLFAVALIPLSLGHNSNSNNSNNNQHRRKQLSLAPSPDTGRDCQQGAGGTNCASSHTALSRSSALVVGSPLVGAAAAWPVRFTQVRPQAARARERERERERESEHCSSLQALERCSAQSSCWSAEPSGLTASRIGGATGGGTRADAKPG